MVIFNIPSTISSYKPRLNLFKTDSVYMNGKWTTDAIKKYCSNIAKKRGFHSVEIQLTIIRDYSNDKYSEELVCFNII